MPSERRERETDIRLVEIVFPHHCNHLGTLFGGQALAWMDKAAFLLSSRYAGCTTVTARSERIDFNAAVQLGEIVEIRAGIRSCGRSSIVVGVSLLRADRAEVEPVVTTSGEFMMVAVDEAGKPVNIQA